jgi:tetratricopeptide (TPR) repeat protein
MPAGLRDAAYQESLSLLDWSNLHPEGGSERFVADLRAKATETFLPHYVLVDSRTGFSDIGGFTTHLLADQVVLVFNLTRACIEGTIQAYRSMISRNEALHFILVASPVPPVADEAGTLIEKRLAAAGEHMERGLIYRQPIIRIDYDARMVLTDELAVTEPEKYGAAARYEKLRDLIQRANPHEVYPAADDAARHLREGRASEAIEALRAFVEEHPDNAEGFAALGGLYRMLNRPEARDAFERAVALAPGLPDGHRGLGEIDLAAGAAASAIEALKRAEAQGDRSPGLYRALCAAYDAERQIAPRRDAGAKLIAAIVREMNDSTEPEPLDSERPITDLRSELIEHLSRFPPLSRVLGRRLLVGGDGLARDEARR